MTANPQSRQTVPGHLVQPQPGQPAYPDIGQNVAVRMLLPVGRSIWAIMAGYLGLLSLLIIPAPFAVVVSIIAIIDIRKSRTAESPKHGMGRAIFGLIMGTLVTLLILVWIVALILDS